jgi:hypothetical protein
MVRYTTFSEHGGSNIGGSRCRCVLRHRFSTSFPVHNCLVIRGRYVLVRLLENGVLANRTSHGYGKMRALRMRGPTVVADCTGPSINQMQKYTKKPLTQYGLRSQ